MKSNFYFLASYGDQYSLLMHIPLCLIAAILKNMPFFIIVKWNVNLEVFTNTVMNGLFSVVFNSRDGLGCTSLNLLEHTPFTCLFIIGPVARKPAFYCMRTTKAQSSMGIPRSLASSFIKYNDSTCYMQN